MNKEILICACGNMEHMLVFSYFKDEPDVYVAVHLVKLPFFKRLWYGLKYICGYKSRYGAFDEIVLNPDDTEKLENIVKHMKQ